MNQLGRLKVNLEAVILLY